MTLKDTKWRVVGEFAPAETTSLQLTDATIQFNCGAKTYQRNLVTGVSTDGLIPAGYIPQCDSRVAAKMSTEDYGAESMAMAENNMFWLERRPDLTLMPGTTTDLPPLDRQTARGVQRRLEKAFPSKTLFWLRLAQTESRALKGAL